MASITLPTSAKRESKSEREAVVPVKFTRSGTPYVESAVAAISPQTLRSLIRQRLDAKQEGEVTPKK